MTIHEHQRYTLHQALETHLGPENAATLMAYLPPVGWADVATKHDLHALEERLQLRISAEIAGVQTEMRTGIAGLQAEMRTGSAELLTKLEQGLRTNMIVTITAMTAIVSGITILSNLF